MLEEDVRVSGLAKENAEEQKAKRKVIRETKHNQPHSFKKNRCWAMMMISVWSHNGIQSYALTELMPFGLQADDILLYTYEQVMMQLYSPRVMIHQPSWLTYPHTPWLCHDDQYATGTERQSTQPESKRDSTTYQLGILSGIWGVPMWHHNMMA